MIEPHTFKLPDGRDLALRPGWQRPGVPPWHVVFPETAESEEAHVSLGFPENDNAVLFDIGGRGYRVRMNAGEAEPFAEKADYWKARKAAGWGFRRRKPAKATP